MLTFKEKISKNYINALGWSTKEKYILLESDDWGAIRMPSISTYNLFIEKKIPVNDLHIDKYDSLESEEDLKALFETLEKFIDKKGNPAALTAYHVVANPNFAAIEANERKKYVYETILETYARNPHTVKSFDLIKQGISKEYIYHNFMGVSIYR